ncbi:MAG: Ig-like domain repeat protein [Terriglobales bacterium]
MVQNGNTVTFTTKLPHGISQILASPTLAVATDTLCTNGRVTVVFAITNSNLNGTFCVLSSPAPTATTFAITVPGSATKFTYTSKTDPNLALANGQVASMSGYSDVGGQNSVISLGYGGWGPPNNPAADGNKWQMKAGTLMHELGHTMALTHGGIFLNNLAKNPNDYTPTYEANCKPNVQTSMSYLFQFDLLQVPGQLNGAGTGPLVVVDYSEDPSLLSPELIPTLTKSSPEGPGILNNLSYGTTAAFQLTSYAGGSSTSPHCDGTPLLSTDKPVTYVPFSPSAFFWSKATGEDINFDGNTTDVLHPHNEWEGTPAQNGVGPAIGLNLQQVSAVGTISTIGPGGEAGGLKPAGGGGGLKPAGGGGGLQPAGGGGGLKPAGGGGGLKPAGGGGLSAEITHQDANSYARPPQALTIAEGVSPRLISLSWFAPSFGTVVNYNVYQSIGTGAFSLRASVSGSLTTYTDTVTCNASGYSYRVTAVTNNDVGQPQESVPSNTVSTSGQTGEKLTGCYTNAAAGSVALTNLAFTDLSSANTPVQGDNIQIAWSLNDDDTGTSVTRAAASSALVAIGPIPADPTCSSLAKPPEYLGYSGTYPYPVTTLSTSGSGITGAGAPFAFTWNTTTANAGCYFFELDLDSHQYEQSTALELLIYVSDSNPHVTTTALPPGVVGNAYSNTIYESGGVSPFTWTYTGSLPSGITLGGSTGTVSGTTCVAGNYSFTTKVTDKNSNYGTQGLTLQINQASTTTSVASSLNASTYGQVVTFTATVAPQYSCTPTGTVTFYDGTTAISGAINLSSATARFTTAALQLIAGTHSITARYSGDSNFYATGAGGSTATVLSQVVNQATTTTSVTSNLNPSTYGQTVTFTAAVAPEYAGTPTGTVTFYDGATAISGAINLSNATASYTTTPLQLAAGTNSITAVYSGDPNFYATRVGGSTATVLSQTVKPAMTATSVSSSLNPSTYGDLVTFTAIVSNASSTPATPTGSVQFVISSYSGSPVTGTPITCPGSAPVYSLCATTSTSSLTVSGSPHTVQANYINTDGDFLTSYGTLTQMVNPGQAVQKADTTATLAVSSGSSTLGDMVSLTATVIDASGGSTGTPTGLVTFLDGTTPIGTGALSGGASDQATFTTSLLSVGTHNLTVQYDGDANFNATGADAGSTATGASETVALRGTTTGVVLNPTVVVGQASTTTITVTDNGSTNPVGTADSWIAASGTPTVGTTGSTATLFADGMVLVAGGTNASGTVVASAYIYNAVSKTFTATTGSLNTARTGATATLLANGEILIAGGSSDGTAAKALNTAELYNSVTGAFTVAGSGSGSVMTAARFGATATLLTNGQVLIAGGENSGGALSSAELYNPANDTFTATGNLGTARYDAAAMLLANGSVLIAGGTGVSGTLNSAELYSAWTFASAGTMTAPRTGATATLLLNGNVLIAGGSTDTAEIYNPTTPAFTAISSTLSYAPVNGTATLLPNGMVLLAGGTSSQTTELYDPDSDKFDATGNLLNTDQPSLTATLLNKDHVLITGLTSGGSPVADAELYTPSFNPLGTVALSSSEPTDGFGGTCVLTPSSGSPAASTCTTTVTPLNVATSPHTITGTYPADAVHSGSDNTASLTVHKADTLTTVSSATSPSIYGQQVTFSATVSVVSPGACSPTGSVQFVVDGSNYGSPVSLTGESASITDSALTAPSHSITAAYSGDPNFNATGSDAGSTATTATQTVTPAMTATSVSSSLNPSTYGGLVTFTAIVSNNSSTAATPTGSVQFVIDSGSPVSGTPITCTGAPPYSLCATTSTSSLTVSGSPHSVQANYINADGDFTTSSGALSPGQTVNPAPVPAISTTALPNGQFNSPYAPLTLSATGGTPPYTFSLGAGGVLPVHMTIDASGSTCGTPNTICGTPAQAGQWSVPITVTDSASSTQTVTLPLTINLASGYAGASNCSMPYPATPLYYSGVTQFGIASASLASTISDTPNAASSSIIASEMNVIPTNNVLTGCLTGNGSGAVTSGVYTLTLSLNGGPSTLPLTLTVVGQDKQDNGTVNVNSGGTGSDVPPNGNQEGVVATGSTFTYLPASYALDSGGEILFGLSGVAPQICDTPTNIITDGPLTAPTQAGRYDILFDGASSCPAAAFPTSPAPIVFESVDAIGTTVTYPAPGNGPTITNVVLSGSGGTSVASNVLEFESGSSATIPVTVSFNYSIVQDPSCPGCDDQIAVGLNSDPGPQACPYSGYPAPTAGSASFTINVPNSPGRYYIGFDRTEEFTCVTTWPNGPPGPSQYIGVVDVWPNNACTSNCAVGVACTSDANCASNACDGITSKCDANQCQDNRKDGNETDIDCGGGTCSACAVGLGCQLDRDCASNACDGISFTCDANQCADNRQDGAETDVDCGGGTCSACALGKKCLVNSDCASNDCDAGSFTCVPHP